MIKSPTDLTEERARLRERIAGQRAALARQLAPVQGMSDASGRIFSLLTRCVAYLRDHPLTLLGAASVLAMVTPNRAWRWAQRSVFVWRSLRTAQGWATRWLTRTRRQ
jgi:hypothetical protein